MELNASEKVILWLLAEGSSDHGFPMTEFHEELHRKNIYGFLPMIRRLRDQEMIGADRANGHHKAMYKLLPAGFAAIGKN